MIFTKIDKQKTSAKAELKRTYVRIPELPEEEWWKTIHIMGTKERWLLVAAATIKSKKANQTKFRQQNQSAIWIRIRIRKQWTQTKTNPIREEHRTSLCRILDEEKIPNEATLDDHHVDEIQLLKNLLSEDLNSIDNLIQQLEYDTERAQSEITEQFAQQRETDRKNDTETAPINQRDKKISGIVRHQANNKETQKDKETNPSKSDKEKKPHNKQQQRNENKQRPTDQHKKHNLFDHTTKRQRQNKQRKTKLQHKQNGSRRSNQQYRENSNKDTEKQEKRQRNSNQRTKYRNDTATHDDPTLLFHLHDKEVEPASEIDRGPSSTTAQQPTEKSNLPALYPGVIMAHG